MAIMRYCREGTEALPYDVFNAEKKADALLYISLNMLCCSV